MTVNQTVFAVCVLTDAYTDAEFKWLAAINKMPAHFVSSSSARLAPWFCIMCCLELVNFMCH